MTDVQNSPTDSDGGGVFKKVWATARKKSTDWIWFGKMPDEVAEKRGDE